MFLKTNVYELNSPKRSKWLKEALDKIPAGKKILDAGAGELRNKEKCTHLDYTSQDLGTYDGVGDRSGLQTEVWDTSGIDIQSDITNIPIESESFDVVLCTEVLEHVPYPIDAVKELARVLKKNGELILTAPFCSLTHFAPQHFYSGFNKYFYERILLDHGLEILECSPNGNYFHYLAQELERLPRMMGDVGKKPSLITKVIIKVLTKICVKVGVLDSKTSDVLCFGYHIRARKK